MDALRLLDTVSAVGIRMPKALKRALAWFKAVLKRVCLVLGLFGAVYAGWKAVLPQEGGLLSLPWTITGVISAELIARGLGTSITKLNWGVGGRRKR